MLSPDQKNYATSNALTEITNHIYKLLDEGNYACGIYNDPKISSTIKAKIKLITLTPDMNVILDINCQFRALLKL